MYVLEPEKDKKGSKKKYIPVSRSSVGQGFDTIPGARLRH